MFYKPPFTNLFFFGGKPTFITYFLEGTKWLGSNSLLMPKAKPTRPRSCEKPIRGAKLRAGFQRSPQRHSGPDVPLEGSGWINGDVRINGLSFHLPINEVRWGYKPIH